MLPSINERFSLALHTTARAWRLALDRRLKDLGLGQASWMAIAAVAKGQPLAQTELARQLCVEDPTMVAMLDRLVKAGYLQRTPSVKDRRVKLVTLTAGGEEIYARVKKEADAFRHALLGDVDPATLASVTSFLENLQTAVESQL